jgi:putative peptidoglycan lipid II flippase
MNLLRALLTVSSLTMVSRVLGYVRDFFIARIFGAGVLTDAFFVAFRFRTCCGGCSRKGASRRPSCRSSARYKNRQAGNNPS